MAGRRLGARPGPNRVFGRLAEGLEFGPVLAPDTVYSENSLPSTSLPWYRKAPKRAPAMPVAASVADCSSERRSRVEARALPVLLSSSSTCDSSRSACSRA
jgi:hypothetical protein